MADQLTVEEKVAQLFFLGTDTPDPQEALEPFMAYGLGGFLAFRHHLQGFSEAMALRDWLAQFKQQFNGAGLSFVGIDQEGGQIERLPHWLFPAGVNAAVLGLQDEDSHLFEQISRQCTRRLRWLGFNLNFAPVVDLNTNIMNPIIGVRAYGDTADQVTSHATDIMKLHLDAGLLPVAKHFPGHGAGTVDSHLALPIFEDWHDQELEPYRRLIAENLPAILVAHGVYPELEAQLAANPDVPASLSRDMVSYLLREQMGFQGLIFTDDLMMGAVMGDMDPVEVGLRALDAGVDVLVYRDPEPAAMELFHVLVQRVKQGKFPEDRLDDIVGRIQQAKQFLADKPLYEYQEMNVTAEANHTLSLQWAQESMRVMHHHFPSPLPFNEHTPWALVMPDRETMVHYQWDPPQDGRDMLQWCHYYGFSPQQHQAYPVGDDTAFKLDSWVGKDFDAIVFVAFNSILSPAQQGYYKTLQESHPKAKMILVSCGMPTDREVLEKPWAHVVLPSYRPSALQAFAQWLMAPAQGA